MLKDFYTAFAAVCFTLLGLWLIVVQTRHSEWRGVPAHRRRAYGVALHFSLPGLMSLLSLVDPASTALWRVSFAIVASSGAIVLLLVRGSLPTLVGRLSYLTAITLYVMVAVVALVPGAVADVGLSARALRVEAVLLIILVFFGVNVAWLLLFDETPTTAHRDSRRPLHVPVPVRPDVEQRPELAARPATFGQELATVVSGPAARAGWQASRPTSAAASSSPRRRQ